MRIPKIPAMVGSQIAIFAVGLALIIGFNLGGYANEYMNRAVTETASTPAKVEAPAPAVAEPEPEKPACETRTHEVKRGDALEKLSVKYYGKRTFVNLLVKENRVVHPKKWIFIRDTLTIPCIPEATAKKPVSPTKTSAAGVVAEEPHIIKSTTTTGEVLQHVLLLQIRNKTQVGEWPEPPLHITRTTLFFPVIMTRRS